MPGNIITINRVSEFYVGDSKMPCLIRFLAENGFPENKEAKETVRETYHPKRVVKFE